MNNSRMNRFLLLLCFSACVSFTACQSRLPEFEDFDYSTTYFAFQYPIRTIVLGESEYYDLTNDHNHRFEIQAAMAGVRENKEDIIVNFEVEPNLLEKLSGESTRTKEKFELKMLPSTHYEPLGTDQMVIEKGNFSGGVLVQLTDAFFEDPLSYQDCYALPIRITTATTDSVLVGRVSTPLVSGLPAWTEKWGGADPRQSSQWLVEPKDFTIYAVKYVNPYHGTYLRRGMEQVEGEDAGKGYGWESGYIEKTNFKPQLLTRGMHRLLYADRLAVSSLKFRALIDVDEKDNTVKITTDEGSENTISGNGKFVKDIEEWGGKKRIAFYLDYKLKSADKTYAVKDTLVFRDNDVAFEEFKPTVSK